MPQGRVRRTSLITALTSPATLQYGKGDEQILEQNYEGYKPEDNVNTNLYVRRSMETKYAFEEVIVLGSPRGGTSMAASLISALGVDLGEMRQADHLNPLGYYEDCDFNHLMSKVLKIASPHATGLCLPEPPDLRRAMVACVGDFSALISDRRARANGGMWGWKATMTPLVFDVLAPLLSKPAFVVVFRNPVMVAKSMVRYAAAKPLLYAQLEFETALKIAMRYYQAILDVVERYARIPRFFLSYEECLVNPSQQVQALAAFLHVTNRGAAVRLAAARVASKRRIAIASIMLRGRHLLGRALGRLGRTPRVRV